MALTAEDITAKNFKLFYYGIKPYLNGAIPNRGFTPIGTVISVMGTSAPENYLVCDGTIYQIDTYKDLADYFEDQFGSKNYFGGNGTTTFAVPDLRGEFLRGTGTNSHTNQGSGANVGVHQDATEHKQYYSYNGSAIQTPQVPPQSVRTTSLNADSYTTSYSSGIVAWVNATGTGNTGSEDFDKSHFTSRPTNTSVLYCIAYRNIYIEPFSNPLKKLEFATNRWLRFDPENHKGLVIKGGTKFTLESGEPIRFEHDTHIDLTSEISTAGVNYFVFVQNDGTFTAVTDKLTGTGVYIGRFHTLCVNAGSSLTMISPASPSSGITAGDAYLVKPYRLEDDPDFYAFYNKTVTSVSAGTPYDVVTTEHPLSGYLAGDILPESVFCASFRPDCLFEDAMVYDKNTNIFVDVYLQSGTGINTRSAYNATHTVSRQQPNFLRDVQTVGKRLLDDREFFSIALGSNECTNITGSSDKTTVGGHSDTNSRRMISAIGVEEACGYLWQWLSNIEIAGGNTWLGYDGRDSFGILYGSRPKGLLGGGAWQHSTKCGSASRNMDPWRNDTIIDGGARGCADLYAYVADATSVKSKGSFTRYSTEEQIVGEWLDGKPVYQKIIYNLTLDSIAQTNWTNYYLLADSNIETFLAFASRFGRLSSNGSIEDAMYDVNIKTNGTYIQIQREKPLTLSNKSYMLIQYTKTTD